MDYKALDSALQELKKKRNELKAIDYNDPRYDDLEEKLHDLEDDFQDEYGDYLEKILKEVHVNHFPDSDILLAIAYMGDGALVESEKYPGKDTRLILESNPPRLILRVGKDDKEVVWENK